MTRINVYSEELTPYVELVTKVADTGRVFFGVRIFIEGSPNLHRGEDDNDESAITFWAEADENDKLSLAVLDSLFARCSKVVSEALRQVIAGEQPSPVRTFT